MKNSNAALYAAKAELEHAAAKVAAIQAARAKDYEALHFEKKAHAHRTAAARYERKAAAA